MRATSTCSWSSTTAGALPRRATATSWPRRCCTSCTARAPPTGCSPSTWVCAPKGTKVAWRATCRIRAYFERWAETWERQALVRARPVAGDSALGERFMALTRSFVWGRPLTPDDVAAIRRMKARIERERISAHEDPQFHLKLGRGSLSDIEWTAQLLQLQHGIDEPSTLGALDAIGHAGVLGPEDVGALRDAYRFCEHTRNRWHLVGALPGGTPPGDSLPPRASSSPAWRAASRRPLRRCATTTGG